MKVRLLIFGQLTDETGASELTLEDLTDTDTLRQVLFERYPSLKTKNFTTAVNNKVISGNTILTDNSTVALMPPFSGG